MNTAVTDIELADLVQFKGPSEHRVAYYFAGWVEADYHGHDCVLRTQNPDDTQRVNFLASSKLLELVPKMERFELAAVYRNRKYGDQYRYEVSSMQDDLVSVWVLRREPVTVGEHAKWRVTTVSLLKQKDIGDYERVG